MNAILSILQNSGVILTPTDTTFGLSCLATDIQAASKINQIKKRPTSKNFILLVDNDARLEQLVKVPDLAWDLIDLSEKPMTIIYDQILNVPAHLISPEGTIAIRITSYLPLKKIIQQTKTPLISTSANISGEQAPQHYQDINPAIIKAVDYILPETPQFEPTHAHSSIIQIGHDHQIKVIRA